MFPHPTPYNHRQTATSGAGWALSVRSCNCICRTSAQHSRLPTDVENYVPSGWGGGRIVGGTHRMEMHLLAVPEYIRFNRNYRWALRSTSTNFRTRKTQIEAQPERIYSSFYIHSFPMSCCAPSLVCFLCAPDCGPQENCTTFRCGMFVFAANG